MGLHFPTGATILGRKDIEQAYRTGRGKIKHVQFLRLKLWTMEKAE